MNSEEAVIIIDKDHTRASATSDCESDCEIIENVTPVIVLDDEQSNDADQGSETLTNSTNETSESADNRESSAETSTPVEAEPLFFIDTNPGYVPQAKSAAPVYSVSAVPLAKDDETKDDETRDDDQMANLRDIRITGPVCFANKENQAAFETTFAPDPQLSSTRLYDELSDESALGPTRDTPSQATNFVISINSTGALRRVSVHSPKAMLPKNSNGDDNLASNGCDSAASTGRSRKRKATADQDEPPSKRFSSDVIVVNDTISDEESVVFISESSGSKAQGSKAQNYISLTNGRTIVSHIEVCFIYCI